MKHLVPSLSALLLAGAATTSLSAASITDEKAGLSVGIGAALQTRLTMAADAQNSSYQNYDSIRGDKGDPEMARFELRRGRIFLNGTYGDGWAGSIVLNADNVDANYAGTANGGTTRSVGLYKATVSKKLQTGAVSHEMAAGYDEPYCYDYATPATTYMTPYANAAAVMTNYGRGMGAFYTLSGDFFRLGASFMNNTNGATKTVTAGSTTTGPNDNTETSTAAASDSNGIDANKGNLATIRLELAPGADLWTAKRAGSFAGASGTQVVLGYDFMHEWGKQVANGTAATDWADQRVLIQGPDILIHIDGLSAGIAYKVRTAEWDRKSNSTGLPNTIDDLHQEALSIEAGYAFPVSTTVLEPVARWSRVDTNRHSNARGDYGRGWDYGIATSAATTGSGDQFEIGVNWYIKGQSNKLQLAYVNWDAANGPARADAVVLQQQLTF